MPKSEKEVIKDRKDIENEQLLNNRKERFRKALGKKYSDKTITLLAKSKIDYHDLEKLIEKGCKKDLALKILS